MNIISKIKQLNINQNKKARISKTLKSLGKSTRKLAKAKKQREAIQKGKLPWWY